MSHQHQAKNEYTPGYGDLTELNSCRLILDTVRETTLKEIAKNYLDLLESSGAIYEANGDYALGIFSSGWCQFLDSASRKLCNTEDNVEALNSGRWICHECCWKEASLESIKTKKPIDIECKGGIRLFAVPIIADGKAVGSMNIGYGDPPTDPEKLQEIAERYQVDPDKLTQLAQEYRPRLTQIIEAAKSQLTISAKLIGQIIESKQVRKSLQFERDRFEKFINVAGHIFVAINADEEVVLINKRGSNVFGYSREEISGKNWFDNFIPERLREDVKEVFSKWVTGEVEAVEYFENPVLTKSGEERLIAWHNTVLYDEVGRFLFSVSSGEDITERKQAEDALQKAHYELEKRVEERTHELEVSLRNESMLADLIRNASLAIGIGYPDGRIGIVNQAFEKLTGYTEDELKEIKWNEVLTPPEWTKHEAAQLEELQRTKQPIKYEKEYLRKDGSRIPVELSVHPRFDEDENLEFYFGFITDLTERKKAEKELVKVQKLESTGILAGGIAHDFNNLLMGILGNISLAKMYIKTDYQALEKLNDAEKATIRAQDLTKQLLTFSKGGEPIRKPAVITPILKDSTFFALTGSNVKCDFMIADNLLPVMIDEGQISQVIQNIVKNADQAMPDGGTITIKAENKIIRKKDALSLNEGRYIQITFEDKGIGIPEKDISKIFDPYFSTKKIGSGLGLAVTYSIIKNHGGIITVESIREKGTVFYIYLPVTEEAPSMPNELEERSLGSGGKILIMDDDKMVIQVASEMLGHIGYESATAGDGAEAIALYQKAQSENSLFDAVILDLTIPGGMGGKETIKKLLEIDPNVKAIVSSGYANDPIMADYANFGFSGVVAKPYTTQELKNVLHSLLD